MLGKGTALVEVRAIDPRNPEASQKAASKHAKVSKSTRLYLQVGAFSDLENAQRLKARLKTHLNRPVRLESADTTNGMIHRVQVGPLVSVEIADQVTTELEPLNIYHIQLLLQ
jgi:rare lipoprotein A